MKALVITLLFVIINNISFSQMVEKCYMNVYYKKAFNVNWSDPSVEVSLDGFYVSTNKDYLSVTSRNANKMFKYVSTASNDTSYIVMIENDSLLVTTSHYYYFNIFTNDTVEVLSDYYSDGEISLRIIDYNEELEHIFIGRK